VAAVDLDDLAQQVLAHGEAINSTTPATSSGVPWQTSGAKPTVEKIGRRAELPVRKRRESRVVRIWSIPTRQRGGVL
jgi:hypothetical protein